MKRNKQKENSLALEKRLLSYFKSKWQFDDYPIMVREIKRPEGRPRTYSAYIINLKGIVGLGETKQGAMLEMQNNFNTYKEKHNDLPRPGVKTLKEYFPYGERKVQFAPTENIIKYQKISDEFFKRIMRKHGIGIPLFISDVSTLSVYEPHDKELAKKQREEVINSVREIYCIDIIKEYDGPLYKIFELIKQKTIPTMNENGS